jgi:hypothetical protein
MKLNWINLFLALLNNTNSIPLSTAHYWKMEIKLQLHATLLIKNQTTSLIGVNSSGIYICPPF